MGFADKLFTLFVAGLHYIGDIISNVVSFLAKPMAFLLWLLEGIVYFFASLFSIVINAVMLFVALFQFLIALASGFFRTLFMWLSFNPGIANPVNFPSASHAGFDAVIKVLLPTGILTVVPLVCIFGVWIGFIFKVFGLLGGSIVVRTGLGGGKGE